jgi:microtubule-associated protein-like 1/2
LSFSKTDGGAWLCCVDDANDKWLSVWQWETGARVASTKCYGDLVFAAEFHPTQPNLMVTCGKQHIIFWHVDAVTQHLVKRSGIFDVGGDKPKYVLCVAFNLNGIDIVSGDSDGSILFWSVKENRVTQAIKNAHDGGVFAIMAKEDQATMITGGKDGSLVEWTCTLNQHYERQRTLNLPEQSGSVRFIAPMSVTGGGGGDMFLVGTTRNSIYQV